MSSNREIRIVRPKDQVRTIQAAGDEYRFLATGAETDGQYFLIEARVPPEGGPPAHVHSREEEAFYILEGELTFYGEDEGITAGPGTYLNIPKGAKHRFRNNTGQLARMLFFFTPAGIEGLFDELSRFEEDAMDPQSSMDAMRKLGAKYGVEYVTE